jgi:outer membrane receptor protein involved in Fe transport
VDAYGQVDASASYDVNRNLSLNFDVTNLNAAKVTTVDVYDVLRTRNDVGRRVTAGVCVKF